MMSIGDLIKAEVKGTGDEIEIVRYEDNRDRVLNDVLYLGKNEEERDRILGILCDNFYEVEAKVVMISNVLKSGMGLSVQDGLSYRRLEDIRGKVRKWMRC